MSIIIRKKLIDEELRIYNERMNAELEFMINNGVCENKQKGENFIMRLNSAKEHAYHDVAKHCKRGDCEKAKSALIELNKLINHINNTKRTI